MVFILICIKNNGKDLNEHSDKTEKLDKNYILFKLQSKADLTLPGLLSISCGPTGHISRKYEGPAGPPLRL